MKIKHIPSENPNDDRAYFHCPGCNKLHAWNPSKWQFFNWDLEKPTVRESILVSWGSDDPRLCHSFITDGFIRFETDSKHHLSGQTVELPDLTEDDLLHFD